MSPQNLRVPKSGGEQTLLGEPGVFSSPFPSVTFNGLL